MNESRVDVVQLQRRDPQAWTAVLTANEILEDAAVTAVTAVPLHPKNAEYYDVLVGGTSTASAKTTLFAHTGGAKLTGARTGQVLVQLNETGDQAIFTASSSGIPRLTRPLKKHVRPCP